MASTTRVTSKGQITIPKQIRERRKIAAGTRLEVAEKGDEIVLRKAGGSDRRRGSGDAEFDAYLERIRGTMDLDMSTDDFMQLLRGE